MRFRECWQDLLRHPRYFTASLLVFAVCAYMGFAQSEQFDSYMRAQIEGIQDLAERIQSQDHYQWWLFLVIFLNNSIKTIMIVLLGAMFGIAPIGFLAINGLLIGYLFAHKAPDVTYGDMLLGIVPHGIIEIPALLLAAACGIRLGWLVLRLVLSGFSAERRKRVLGELRDYIGLLPALTIILLGAMLVAAIIESTLTIALIGG